MPTRASLLTGLYPHQAGVGQMTFDRATPGYRGFLTPNTVTIAEVLRASGYRTGMLGKWHLSLTGQAENHLDRLDQGVGRIVAKLDQLGELDNTLILFFADNGASPERMSGPGFDRPSRTRDGRKMVYRGTDVMPGPENTYFCIGRMWANTANTPFRYWKKEQYEGGVATPMIAHWPEGMKTKPGSITRQPGHVIDVMATCLDVSGARYPAMRNGHRMTPPEGKSLVPIFAGRQRAGHDAIFFEHYGARGVRQGDWKLVALANRPWELYNLAEDRTEMNDRAAEFPERVEQLNTLWEQWAHRARVVLPSKSVTERPTGEQGHTFRVEVG